MAKKTAPQSDFDKIVEDVVQKSVVTAPSDPNGGAKLPDRQADQPRKKRRDKTSYMAIFDREAGESDDQLDEWERDTNDLTESPDRFVNDKDDTPEDPDEEDEDARGNEEYDALADDDEDEDEDEELGDERVVKVKAHKRRLKKAVRGDHADEDETLSDDDDDLDEDDDEDEDEDDEGPKKPMQPSKAKEERRRKEVRKALGKDANDMVDASPLVKALVDAVYDLRDDTISELRQHVSTLRRQNKALAGRISALEGNVRGDMRSMTKSLTAGVAAMVSPVASDEAADPVRKGYGAPVATRKRFPGGQGFNWSKSADVLQKALEDGVEGVRNTDITLIETDKSPQSLSPGAQAVLRKANLIS